MKRQKFLLAIALLVSSSIVSFGSLLPHDKRWSHLQILRSKAIGNVHLNGLDRAYLDATAMLERRNACGEFFGGAAATQVLDNLAVTLQDGLISDHNVGLMMSGRSTNFYDSQTGISYRLFADALINSIGPFYKSKVWPEDPFFSKVGSFRPNTREARVLILLHELAHLIKGPNGTWLIPDDGGSPELSKKNTLTVESRCGEQIRSL
jgi:hypothetical protein